MQELSVIHIAIAYLVIINMVTFFIYGVDKWKARHAKWRVSETTLLLLAVIGGSIGAWLGMRVWHHKTLHKKFRYGIPAIIILQIAFLVFAASMLERCLSYDGDKALGGKVDSYLAIADFR